MSLTDGMSRIRSRMVHDEEFRQKAIERIQSPEVRAKAVAGQHRMVRKKVNTAAITEPIFKSLANVIKDTDMPASKLSELTGYDDSTIREFLYHGRALNPRFRTVKDVASALGYDL